MHHGMLESMFELKTGQPKDSLLYLTFSGLGVILLNLFCLLCRDDEETQQGHPRGENKYIVYESCLLECFRLCMTCYAPSKPPRHLSGSCLTVTTLCPKYHSHTWSSQPYVGRKPVGNVDIASVLLFSGCRPAQALRMPRLMNIRVISDRKFHDYQQAYLLPAVQKVRRSLV